MGDVSEPVEIQRPAQELHFLCYHDDARDVDDDDDGEDDGEGDGEDDDGGEDDDDDDGGDDDDGDDDGDDDDDDYDAVDSDNPEISWSYPTLTSSSVRSVHQPIE